METEMGERSNETSMDTDLHRPELLQQAKEVDPLVDLEIYASDDDNTKRKYSASASKIGKQLGWTQSLRSQSSSYCYNGICCT
ncbi:hypothetical protein Acr_00g0033330 [Actinidia rufa]|uniref:Uncharacterized protein n=1 Tax=Actinidia rufa TaxID=165716 RepID=A0A7J0DHJ4_9ERIC|nr:hypothetical protein Acr_00g0033330 [Actinidia rufa]